MRCFVVTKKHIAAILCTVIAGSSVIILSHIKHDTDAITAFNNVESDEIIADVLPTEKEPSGLSKIKNYMSSAIKKEPQDILESLGGIFESHQPAATPPIPSPEPTIAPSETPTEQRTAKAEQMLKNDTDYEISVDIFENEPLAFSGNAEILIIHTHTTESYTPEEPTGLPDNSRSTDESKNMIAVGDVIKSELENAGIKVVHDKTVHDYPSYQGAYGRSLTTASKNIKQNDKIQIVLDIHRDAVVNADGTRVKLVKNIDGTAHAQMMIVCGTDGGGLSHPGWRHNLNFAIKIQNQMQSKYPDLMRPINLREERFNQHLTPGSLILEIGTHGNTLTEAKKGATLLAREIAQVIAQ